jgi:hypothetical protein
MLQTVEKLLLVTSEFVIKEHGPCSECSDKLKDPRGGTVSSNDIPTFRAALLPLKRKEARINRHLRPRIS